MQNDRTQGVARTKTSLVETGPELRLYLESVIPFAGSRLRQATRIEVETGARLVFWEGFLAGRVGRGECWRSVYIERFRLRMALNAPPTLWVIAAISVRACTLE